MRLRAVFRRYRNKTRVELATWQRPELDEVVMGCQELAEAVREARAMGDPSDTAVQAWWRRHRRNPTITMSPGTDPAGYPELPELPLGPRTGRVAAPDGQVGPLVHQPPRRKSRAGIIVDL
jgi:hypothetical protein